MNDRSIQEILKVFDKLLVFPAQLAHWTRAKETTAKNMYNDKTGTIQFRYYIHDKEIKFFLKDCKARDCLVKSIEIHLPSIPDTVQGFFTVLKYNLKNVKFD